MKRILCSIIALCAVLCASAQDSTSILRFGYLSYKTALQSMPQYPIVQERMAALREQYQAETKRVEEEFNRKYEDFLEGQREFPKTILQKRQTELQELLQRNLAFKQQGLKDLAKAEADALAPLRKRLDGIIADVARNQGLTLVVNTDANACPFIDPEISIDLQPLVTEQLNAEEAEETGETEEQSE